MVHSLADRLPAVPADTATAIRLNAGVQVVAAVLLASGRLTRVSALALAVTLVPVTWAGHRFWEAEDEQERAQQRIHFLKNLSMLGGLLITAADTGSGPSLAWRARQRVRGISHKVGD
ncbi:DoxX family protein [Kitasatospora sp. GP82]|uniref:DoxX family protein n=1 Tax=Kitasatospora sp. GP82 TaxID=3035089 RepID=UPI00247CC8BD|nr:putative oxidoreductase [Kitasatospora sp. GP82]